MNYAMTIAGFDGSAGAGILTDIKTMQFFDVYGTAVCTALTVQNEYSFARAGFLPWKQIEEQLEKLAEVRRYSYFKIGLIENAEMLWHIITWIRKHNQNAFILWDPIMGSSTGIRFFVDRDVEEFFPIFSKINLLTPNRLEYEFLKLKNCELKKTAILSKGGHADGDESEDILYENGKEYRYSSKRLPGVDKHGSGCTLSAAILANVALGKSLPEACAEAKKYIAKWFIGGENKIGFVPRLG